MHSFFYNLVMPLIKLFVKIRFGYSFKKAKFKTKENYIVLSNHTTDFDMLFVASSFRKPMYFVGSEHIARWKTLYAFLKVCFDPIMRNKGASAATAVKEIKRRLNAGANICFFPEGVRSWDGETAEISFSTAKLVKTSGCGLITYKITGGYFVSPMWGKGIRRGKICGEPVRYLSREEISALSTEEIYDIIIKDLYENAYARQQKEMLIYKGKDVAKGIEKLIYICPECKKKDSFITNGNQVHCMNCGYSFDFDEYGFLDGGLFGTLKEFSDWQKTETENDIKNGAVYVSEATSFVKIKNHNETKLDVGRVILSPETLKIGENIFPMSEISDLAMCGNRKVVFTHDKDYYEFIPDNNALKYMIYYNKLKQKEMR